jgi:uncharacterized protein YndB with AHSA1/START domain
VFSKEFSVDIDAPIEQVFSYVTELKRHPEWSNNKMEMSVEGEPVAVGTTFETAVSAFGKETNKGRVVEMQAPTKFVYECDTSASGLWRWTMSLEPIAGGTRLSHKAEGLRVPGWFKVVQPLMFPFVGKKMQTNGLQNIKARVEAGGGK